MITQLPPRPDVLARRDAIVAGLRRLLPPDAVIADPLLLQALRNRRAVRLSPAAAGGRAAGDHRAGRRGA